MNTPSPDMLRKLLRHDPDTGKLFWRRRPVDMFEDGKQSADHNCKAWNAKFVGKEAVATPSNGYMVGYIFGKGYRAHRVIWAIVHGEWPPEEIDHIDHNRSNNLIKNLRCVSRAENNKNRMLGNHSTSGVLGVYWTARDKKWTARVTSKGKSVYLGAFSDKDDAIAARISANKKYGYHVNHGATA